MTTHERIERLTHPARGGVLFAVLYRNAGWGFQWYEGPEREDDSVPDDWRQYLVIHGYYPTLGEALEAEERRLGVTP